MKRLGHLTEYRLINICLCFGTFEGSRVAVPTHQVCHRLAPLLHPETDMPCQVLPPFWCSFRVASSACVLYGIAWEGTGSGAPNPTPFCHHSLTCRDPGQVDPPFQMSQCAGNSRDLKTGHRGSGCVVSGYTETVLQSILITQPFPPLPLHPPPPPHT